MIAHILVPLDGSELSESALPMACELAKAFKAKITLLGVVAPPPGRWGGVFRNVLDMMPDLTLPDTPEDLDRTHHPVSKDSQMASLESEVKRQLMPSMDRIREHNVEATVATAYGRAADTILRFVEQNAVDMIVMSTHGDSGLHMYGLGSTSDRIMRRSPVPVTLVRPDEIISMMSSQSGGNQ